MGSNDVVQIEAVEDGCLYVYAFATGSWTKVCRIASFDDLPRSVKNKLRTVGQEHGKRGGKERCDA
jgi:hypothetical protein